VCFVYGYTDFSAAEKDSGVKFCVRVRLLSGQVFSPFGELWLSWSNGGGITSGMSYIHIAPGKNACMQITPGEKLRGKARWAVGIGGGGVA